jgi:hypothetical protein
MEAHVNSFGPPDPFTIGLGAFIAWLKRLLGR